MIDPRECRYLCGKYVDKVYKVKDLFCGHVWLCAKCKKKMEGK